MVNKRRWLCRAAGAGLAAIGPLCGTGVLARADGTNTLITAPCTNGQTLTTEIPAGNGAFPSALRVVDSTSVFTIHQFKITSASGQTFIIKNDSGVANNQDLVSCTYASTSGTGNVFTWTGFFTPAP
jgi:spore coat protein U-like protein